MKVELLSAGCKSLLVSSLLLGHLSAFGKVSEMQGGEQSSRRKTVQMKVVELNNQAPCIVSADPNLASKIAEESNTEICSSKEQRALADLVDEKGGVRTAIVPAILAAGVVFSCAYGAKLGSELVVSDVSPNEALFAGFANFGALLGIASTHPGFVANGAALYFCEFAGGTVSYILAD